MNKHIICTSQHLRIVPETRLVAEKLYAAFDQLGILRDCPSVLR